MASSAHNGRLRWRETCCSGQANRVSVQRLPEIALGRSGPCDRALAVKAGELLLGPLSRQQERMDRRLPVRTSR